MINSCWPFDPHCGLDSLHQSWQYSYSWSTSRVNGNSKIQIKVTSHVLHIWAFTLYFLSFREGFLKIERRFQICHGFFEMFRPAYRPKRPPKARKSIKNTANTHFNEIFNISFVISVTLLKVACSFWRLGSHVQVSVHAWRGSTVNVLNQSQCPWNECITHLDTLAPYPCKYRHLQVLWCWKSPRVLPC